MTKQAYYTVQTKTLLELGALATHLDCSTGEAIEALVETSLAGLLAAHTVAGVPPALLPLPEGNQTKPLRPTVSQDEIRALEDAADILGYTNASHLLMALVHQAYLMECPPDGQEEDAVVTLPVARFHIRPVLVYSGWTAADHADGAYWPSMCKLEPIENWRPGMSYWQEDEIGFYHYQWSGNLGEDERMNMVDWMLTSRFHTVLSPSTGSKSYPTAEAFESACDAARPMLEGIADLWLESLTRIEEADARRQNLWPVPEVHTREEAAAAYLHYIRKNPGLTGGRTLWVARECGIHPEEELWNLLKEPPCLTQVLTCPNGTLIADYPWKGMT